MTQNEKLKIWGLQIILVTHIFLPYLIEVEIIRKIIRFCTLSTIMYLGINIYIQKLRNNKQVRNYFSLDVINGVIFAICYIVLAYINFVYDK